MVSDGEEIFLGFVRPSEGDTEHHENPFAGRGAQDPRVAEVVSQFSDVLVFKPI